MGGDMWLETQTSISNAKDVAAIAGVGIAALTFIITAWKGISEYLLQGVQKRTEHFIGLRKNLDEDKQLRKIIDALDDDVALLKNKKEIPQGDKRYFLGFFEQIALMMNSKLISVEVANYMFGYYAIRCWDTDEFWENMKQEKHECHWSLFKDFVEQMKSQDKILKRETEAKDLNTRHTYLRKRLRFRSLKRL
jgi:hypothetical protein